MLFGVPKEDASSGSVLPLILSAKGSLKWGIQDKDRAAKGVLVFPKQVVFELVFREFGEWRHAIGVGRDVVPDVDCVVQSIGPESSGDSFGPSVCGMKQHGPGLLHNVPDSLLNFAILMMCSDAAEGHGLTLLSGMFSEEGVSKSAVVSMIVFDDDVV